jgi:thiol-disulfide isomerase/thioredoxin
MRRAWYLAAFVLIATAAAATGALWHSHLQTRNGAAGSGAGTAALAQLRKVAWPDLQGKPQALTQWEGRILVVNFWATWCEPCREEIPAFVRIQNELGTRGVQFVGFAVEPGDRLSQVRQFVREMKVNYPNLMGDYAALGLVQDVGNPTGALPFTLILDRKGGVGQTHLGRLSEVKLREMIAKML